MSSRTFYHVVPDGEKWTGKTEAGEIIASGDNKAPVVEETLEHARNNQPSSVRIHRADGTFEDERTYQDDPFPPRG